MRLSFAEYKGAKQFNCIPHILKNVGYESLYFHGNRSRFYNRVNYIPKLGFGSSYFHADERPLKDDGREYLGWGLSDADMYNIMLDTLESKEGPFFAGMMTLSNHYPFTSQLPIDVPYKITRGNGSLTDKQLYDNYRSSTFYSDYALGEFWKRFKASKLFENTIVLITSDHGIWTFPSSAKERTEAYRNELFFRAPLVIYHPDYNKSVAIDQIASHVDILPTIMDMLGLEFNDSFFIGKSIFKKVFNPWVVMAKSGELLVRQEQQLCYVDSQGCGGAQQVCFSSQDPEKEFLQEQCDTINGNVLKGGNLASDSSMTNNIIEKGFHMVKYENNRVFTDLKNLALYQPKHITKQELDRIVKKEM